MVGALYYKEMVINVAGDGEGSLDIIVLQGEVEGIKLIDCELDKEKVELHFENFFLQGQVKKEVYTVVEREETGNGYSFKRYPVVNQVYFFNRPPKYKLNKKQSRR